MLSDPIKKILTLAIPMILANLSQPLLGLVDTAVLGHLDSPAFLAGAAVGAFFISQLLWICGFLRMSMTGLSAQSFGLFNAAVAREADTQQHTHQSTSIQTNTPNIGRLDDLSRACIIAMILGMGLILASPFWLELLFGWTTLSGLAAQSLSDYVVIRFYNVPVALLNLVLIGYLVGQQQARLVMTIQIVGNALNIALNLILAVYLDMAVKGVAYATVISEWAMLLMALAGIYSATIKAPHLASFALFSEQWRTLAKFKRILSLNRDLFLRSIFLQGCLAFVTYRGARYGVTEAAVNAILMQFFIIIALGLDGIAYAIEAVVGESEGKTDKRQRWRYIIASIQCSSVLGIVFCFIFAFGFDQILHLLTAQSNIISAAQAYYWIILALPLIAHWCYCLDGIYIGLTRGDVMRNSMFISALFGFMGVYVLTSQYDNMALWFALLGLQAMRGITLGWHLKRHYSISSY